MTLSRDKLFTLMLVVTVLLTLVFGGLLLADLQNAHKTVTTALAPVGQSGSGGAVADTSTPTAAPGAQGSTVVHSSQQAGPGSGSNPGGHRSAAAGPHARVNG